MEVSTTGKQYCLDGFHDGAKTIMSLLLLTNSQNFERRRREIMCRALDLKFPNSKKACLEDYLTRISRRNPNKPGSPAILNIPPSVAKGLLSGEMTPYQAVGIIKEKNRPNINKAAMRDIWAKLSVIDGLWALEDKAVSHDWEESLSKDAKLPKLEALAVSLESSGSQPAVKGAKTKFVENYPHLRASFGESTNWAEVVTFLDPKLGGLLKSLLNSSKESLDKGSVIESYLWPEGTKGEAENRRLNTLLGALGNRPTGRKRRYEKIMLNLEPECQVSDLPEVDISSPTPKEIFETKKLISQAEDFFKSARKKDFGSPRHRRILGKLKKTNLPQAQELWKKAEARLDSDYSLQYASSKLRKLVSLNQGHIGACLRKLLLGKTIDSDLELEASGLLNRVEDKKDFIERHILGSKLETLRVVRQWMDKCLYKMSGSWKDLEILEGTRASDMLSALRESRGFDFCKSYHSGGLTSLHLACVLGSPSEVAAICDYYIKNNMSLSPETDHGKTPLDMAGPDNLKVLLDYGGTLILTHGGRESGDSNYHLGSHHILTEARKKKKVLAKLKSSQDEDLFGIL